jgi:hypothetical protein
MSVVETDAHASDEFLIAAAPRSTLGRLGLRLRVRLRRRRLDRMLAEGRSPWSRPDLAFRASQVLALRSRRRVAAAISGLLDLAEIQRLQSIYPLVRSVVVLEEHELLTRIAARLRDPAPIPPAPVVVLRFLTSSSSSPAFVHGGPASGFGAAVRDCAAQLGV